MKTHKKKFLFFSPILCSRVSMIIQPPLKRTKHAYTFVYIYNAAIFKNHFTHRTRSRVVVSYIHKCVFFPSCFALLAFFLMISHTERREVPIEIDNKCERSFFVLSIKKNIFFNEEQQWDEKGKIYSVVSLSLWSSTSSTIHKMPENVFLNVFIKITYTKVCIVQYAVAASSSFLRKDHRWM